MADLDNFAAQNLAYHMADRAISSAEPYSALPERVLLALTHDNLAAHNWACYMADLASRWAEPLSIAHRDVAPACVFDAGFATIYQYTNVTIGVDAVIWVAPDNRVCFQSSSNTTPWHGYFRRMADHILMRFHHSGNIDKMWTTVLPNDNKPETWSGYDQARSEVTISFLERRRFCRVCGVWHTIDEFYV